ncbi:hypothetical protein [Dethiothermospora halolimnae]|uniref:hypothetical protein n=1 Tax=Dethiothermospora halolimnae TaxID=3114390 RepID=UPI003CCB8C18
MNVNPIIVRILAERIINKGLNPKTGEILVLDDVKNEEYRKAVEDYILEHSDVI